MDDEKIDCIVISTRHNLHAKLVSDSLKKGKDVFAEKPLALTYDGFEAFFSAVKDDKPIPVDFEEYVFTTLATFGIMESIGTGVPVNIDNKILKL